MDIEFCPEIFPSSVEAIIWVLFSSLLMWCITLIDLQILNQTLHPWNKSHFIMVCEPFNMLLNAVCQYFVQNFRIYAHQWYWHVLFFLCVISLSSFGRSLGFSTYKSMSSANKQFYFFLSDLDAFYYLFLPNCSG